MYVGLGLGDSSEEIRRIKAFMRQKFSYASTLRDSTLYDAQMVNAVAEMQKRYTAAGKLRAGRYSPGVINAETKYVMGFLVRPSKPRPVLFTVEGHMSNMWVGPCAEVARILEAEGVCRWQPIGYNCTALPFDNDSGIRELRRLLADTSLLPTDCGWGLAIFSQGAIIGTEVFQALRQPSDALHYRLATWRATLAFGSPYRQRDVVADWVPDPPRAGTEGISDIRLTDTPAMWKEVARTGDLYSENEQGDSGEHKRAIYQAVQNRWTGNPDTLLSQMVEIFQRPVPELLAMISAITSGILFVGNMSPHGGYDLRPCLNFMRAALT